MDCAVDKRTVRGDGMDCELRLGAQLNVDDAAALDVDAELN